MANDLNNLLNKLNKLASPSSCDNALEASGEAIVSTAKDNCPVETGALKESIKTKTTNGKSVTGSNLEYAPFVEYGTLDTPARPFLYPALESNKDKIINNFKEAIKKALK